MKLSNETLKALLLAVLGADSDVEVAFGSSYFQVGKSYFVRAVTYHYTGRCVSWDGKELVLADAAWVADSGRFSEALASGKLAEVEPYPDDVPVVLMAGAIVDGSLWKHPLPREVIPSK